MLSLSEEICPVRRSGNAACFSLDRDLWRNVAEHHGLLYSRALGQVKLVDLIRTSFTG